MNVLDVAIAVLCIGFAVYGIFQGVVRQLFSWTGLVFGHVAGIRFYEPVQGRLGLDFPHGDIVGYLLVFLSVYLVFRILGLVIERWVRGSELSGTDRFAGMLAGLLKGAVLSVLLVFVLVILLPPKTALLRESKLAPAAMVAARWGQKVFPEGIRDSFRRKAEGLFPPQAGKKDSPEDPQSKKRSRK